MPSVNQVLKYLRACRRLDKVLQGQSVDKQLSVLIPKLTEIAVKGKVKLGAVMQEIIEGYSFQYMTEISEKEWAREESRAKARAKRITKKFPSSQRKRAVQHPVNVVPFAPPK